MSNINDGGLAFPVPMVRYDDGNFFNVTDTGMTLRDWFAGQALQGILSSVERWSTRNELIAEACYQAADAMIAAREAKSGS